MVFLDVVFDFIENITLFIVFVISRRKIIDGCRIWDFILLLIPVRSTNSSLPFLNHLLAMIKCEDKTKRFTNPIGLAEWFPSGVIGIKESNSSKCRLFSKIIMQIYSQDNFAVASFLLLHLLQWLALKDPQGC